MGELIGRSSLRADAVYCAVAAVCVAASSAPLSRALGVPVAVLVVVAVATLAWAAWLRTAARLTDLRPALRRVLAANAVGACLVAALAVTRPVDALSLLLLGVAVEVAAFAVWQAVALRRTA